MDLLDRYLHAVKGYLPPAQQADIVQELRENILAQVEEKENSLGRALNEIEQEALLRQYGHPMVLASRYGPRRYLIGPAMFPIYWYTLKMSLGIVALVCLLLPAVALLVAPGHAGSQIMNPLGSFFRVLAPMFTVMTLVFAGMDYFMEKSRSIEKWTAAWSPRSLPPVPSGGPVPPRSRRVGELIASLALGAWWLLALKYQFLILGPTRGLIRLSPVWAWFYIPFVILVTVGIAQSYISLVWPRAKAFRTAADLVKTGGGAVVCLLLARSGDLIEPVVASAPGNGLAAIYNTGFVVGLSIGALVSTAQFFLILLRIFRQRGDGGFVASRKTAGTA